MIWPLQKGTKALTTTSSVEAAHPLPPVPRPRAAGTGSPLGLITAALEDAKAEEIVALDMAGKSALADHMLIASGRSDRHVMAIADRVVQALKERRHEPVRVEGMNTGEWVLIDAGDVIVHVFKPETRQFYNLERLWGVDRPGEVRAV